MIADRGGWSFRADDELELFAAPCEMLARDRATDALAITPDKLR